MKKILIVPLLSILLLQGCSYLSRTELAKEISIQTIPYEENVEEGWMTYTNQELGYQINLPSDWTVQTSTPHKKYISFISPEIRNRRLPIAPEDIPASIFHNISITVFNSIDNPVEENNYSNLEDYLKNYNDGHQFSKVTSIELNNLNGFESIENSEINRYTIILEENNKIYKLAVPRPNKEDLTEIEKQILSSFRLTNIDTIGKAEVINGQVYYIDSQGENHLIAEKVDHENPYRSRHYQRAEISPNGEYIALREYGSMGGGSINIYDISTKESHRTEPDSATNNFYWMADNRLRIDGECGMAISCGMYESIDNQSPWILEKKGEISDPQIAEENAEYRKKEQCLAQREKLEGEINQSFDYYDDQSEESFTGTRYISDIFYNTESDKCSYIIHTSVQKNKRDGRSGATMTYSLHETPSNRILFTIMGCDQSLGDYCKSIPEAEEEFNLQLAEFK